MIPNDQIVSLAARKIASRLESRRRFSAFGFVVYMNGKTAKKSRCVRARVGRVRVLAVYKPTLIRVKRRFATLNKKAAATYWSI